MSLMTHQDVEVYVIIVNHSYNAKEDGLMCPLGPSSSRSYIFASSRMLVQTIGLFAQVTFAPEFGLPRAFNQKLLVLHIW